MRHPLGVVLHGDHDRSGFDFSTLLICRDIVSEKFIASFVIRNHIYRVRLVKLPPEDVSFVSIFKTDKVTKMTKIRRNVLQWVSWHENHVSYLKERFSRKSSEIDGSHVACFRESGILKATVPNIEWRCVRCSSAGFEMVYNCVFSMIDLLLFSSSS